MFHALAHSLLPQSGQVRPRGAWSPEKELRDTIVLLAVAHRLMSLPDHIILEIVACHDFPAFVVIVIRSPTWHGPCTRAPQSPELSFVGVAFTMFAPLMQCGVLRTIPQKPYNTGTRARRRRYYAIRPAQ